MVTLYDVIVNTNSFRAITNVCLYPYKCDHANLRAVALKYQMHLKTKIDDVVFEIHRWYSFKNKYFIRAQFSISSGFI